MQLRYLTGAILICASPAAAEDEDSEAAWIDAHCTTISKFAETIMESRQAGVSMTDMMQIARQDEFKQMAGSIRMMIKSAYEEPRYQIEEFQNKVTIDFRDKWALLCYEALEDEDDK